ncbi:MAG: succinate dehydrogenase cytochrome b subunit [Bacteroidales bacterium]|nr:succinate dehydrogenase cytochrome b subunit [Bacteroidales bacterium]
MQLPKIHSITKKMLVALVGGFLLLFLLFHMTANLFILRHDDGAWYSAFCHFMGTNWVVKLFEVVLLGVLALHILLTLWLALTNRLARPVRYKQRQRSETHTTSKLMMWTGILIFAFLVMHFCQFYFVKIGWVKGEYMVEVEKLQTDEVNTVQQFSMQQGMSPEDFVSSLEGQLAMYADQMPAEEYESMVQNIANLRGAVPVAGLLSDAVAKGHLSENRKWVRHLDYDQRQMLKKTVPDCGVEPDFYYMSRQLFHNALMVILYLIAFVALFMHLTHAFPSVFQSLGLNNYKYNNFIEICGKIYTWVITLGFAAVPILVYIGL